MGTSHKIEGSVRVLTGSEGSLETGCDYSPLESPMTFGLSY